MPPSPHRRSDRERELDTEIDAVEQLIAGKLGDTARVSAMRHASALRAERSRIRQVRLAQRENDELVRISLLRTISEREGSWTAASAYQRAEADLRAALAQADAAKAQAEMTDLDADDLLNIIIDALADMPMDMAQAIHTAAVTRLDEPIDLVVE
jgi:uncharacterized membrane protein YqiK